MRRVTALWFGVFILIVVGFLVRSWCEPTVVIVPHHNVVAAVRKRLLMFVASRRISTTRIILISPDHFSINQHEFLTGTKTLGGLAGIAFDPTTVDADHGITNVYADLVNIWPKAQIDTLIIGQKTTAHQLVPVLALLKSSCKNDCLLVASVDFSHYLPQAVALTHDQMTLSFLSQQASNALLTSEVDSPQSLYLTSELARYKHASQWRLFDHTISGEVETTSHVFGWYQRGFPSSKVSNDTFVFINSKTDLAPLGTRLTYGSAITSTDQTARLNNIHLLRGETYGVVCTNHQISITVPPESIVSGWNTGNLVTVGLTSIPYKDHDFTYFDVNLKCNH